MNHINSGQYGRQVTTPLAIGVLFIPGVFVWFLLRKGYSTVSRVVGFGWFALVLTPFVMAAMKPPIHPPQTTDFPEVTQGTGWDDDGTSGWRYDQKTDEMRGSVEYRARLDSANSLDFAFPYNGGSTGRIELRRARDSGLNILLRISRGQFICHQFTDPQLSVKFDQGPIQKFRCATASDGNTSVIFIEPEGRMLAGLKHADKLVIETEFYHEGIRQLDFNAHGLKW